MVLQIIHPTDAIFAKKKIFNEIIKIAKEHGVDNVAEGSNMDDISDYRPGLRAINELNVFSPLQKAELSKDEIRALSRQLGLSTWKKTKQGLFGFEVCLWGENNERKATDDR